MLRLVFIKLSKLRREIYFLKMNCLCKNYINQINFLSLNELSLSMNVLLLFILFI